MALVRCALLGALVLAADGSLVARARRLGGVSDACMEACPMLEAFADPDALPCQYHEAISCLEDHSGTQENPGVCDGAVSEDFQEVKSYLACICDLCPGIIEAQYAASDLIQRAAKSPLDEVELEGTMCRLASCMKCAAGHAAQCTLVDMQWGMVDEMSTMMDEMHLPSCHQDATCSASTPESGLDANLGRAWSAIRGARLER